MKKIISISLILILAGCSVYKDFTTYFNRYYIAKSELDEVELKISESDISSFEFKKDYSKIGVKEKIENVIQKCSKILQYNTESSYVNDALFLIGKAMFYKGDFIKAERKFMELYAASSEEYFAENLVWLGNTKLQLREYDTGLNFLNTAIDTSESFGATENANKARVVLASYFIYNEELSGSVKQLEKILEKSEDEKLLAETNYTLGITYKKFEKFQEAIDAFKNVENFDPTPQIEIDAKLNMADLYNTIDQGEKSIEILDDLADNSKYEKYFDKIELQLGLSYYTKGDIFEALDILTLVDTTYKRSKYTSNARYYRAKILEEELNNLDSAMSVYKSVVGSLAEIEIRNDAAKRLDYLRTYKNLKENIESSNIGLLYLSDTTAYLADYDFYKEQRLDDSLNIVTEKPDAKEAQIKSQLDIKWSKFKPTYPSKPIKELKLERLTNYYELANHFYTNMFEYDSAKVYFDNVFDNYPDSLRDEKYYYSLGAFYSTIEENEIADSLLKIVYYNYPESKFANLVANRLDLPIYETEKDPAGEKYLMIEEYVENNNLASALQEIDSLIAKYPESLFAPKALYFKAWVYNNKIENLDSLLITYDSLIAKYPNTEYSKLGEAHSNIITQKINERIKLAKQDSINKLKLTLGTDSLTVDSLKADSLGMPLDSLKFVPDSLLLENDTTSVKEDSVKNKKFIPDFLKEELENNQKNIKTKKEDQKKKPVNIEK